MPRRPTHPRHYAGIAPWDAEPEDAGLTEAEVSGTLLSVHVDVFKEMRAGSHCDHAPGSTA
eukprot:3693275-Amphidinium_carterae.1